MRIAYITAGAAGMFCGSCMRDNALVRALQSLGHDAVLVPTYTPIRTDQTDVSEQRIFYGGINVYLQDKSAIFRHTPRWFDRVLDRPSLLRRVSRFAQRTRYEDLGGLTVSILQGNAGHQAKELQRLAAALNDDFKPQVVVLTNVLLSGMIPELRRRLGVPVLATLQGDDVFLDALHADDKARCIGLIRDNCSNADGLIATSVWYADHMSGYLGIERSRIEVIPPGIHLDGYGGPPIRRGDGRPVIGFFARIAPEKGLHNLVDAFIELRKRTPEPVLRASGWLGELNRTYLQAQRSRLAAAGLADDFEYVDSPSLGSKSDFLRSLDVLCVPTIYREPKGLYVLEAWANGVPVVLPAHGCFPELVRATGGGRLVEPNDSAALAGALHEMISDRAAAAELGRAGQAAVRERFTAEAMARATANHLERFLGVPA